MDPFAVAAGQRADWRRVHARIPARALELALAAFSDVRARPRRHVPPAGQRARIPALGLPARPETSPVSPRNSERLERSAGCSHFQKKGPNTGSRRMPIELVIGS